MSSSIFQKLLPKAIGDLHEYGASMTGRYWPSGVALAEEVNHGANLQVLFLHFPRYGESSEFQRPPAIVDHLKGSDSRLHSSALRGNDEQGLSRLSVKSKRIRNPWNEDAASAGNVEHVLNGEQGLHRL